MVRVIFGVDTDTTQTLECLFLLMAGLTFIAIVLAPVSLGYIPISLLLMVGHLLMVRA
jgi:hypothetical protein